MRCREEEREIHLSSLVKIAKELGLKELATRNVVRNYMRPWVFDHCESNCQVVGYFRNWVTKLLVVRGSE